MVQCTNLLSHLRGLRIRLTDGFHQAFVQPSAHDHASRAGSRGDEQSGDEVSDQIVRIGGGRGRRGDAGTGHAGGDDGDDGTKGNGGEGVDWVTTADEMGVVTDLVKEGGIDGEERMGGGDGGGSCGGAGDGGEGGGGEGGGDGDGGGEGGGERGGDVGGLGEAVATAEVVMGGRKGEVMTGVAGAILEEEGSVVGERVVDREEVEMAVAEGWR